MSARRLPEPIKPRKMMHADDGRYVTSDGWLRFTPRYDRRRLLGYSIETLRAPDLPHNYGMRSLWQWRDMYCAPGGKVPWLVADMDQGVLRIEPTRAAALAWFKRKHGCDRVRERKQYGEHYYAYTLATSGEYATSADIVRADHFHRQGGDPLQQPLYPFPDAPHEYVPRPGEEEYVDGRRYAERL